MNLFCILIIFLLSCDKSVIKVPELINYELTDLNVNSLFYGQVLSHDRFLDKVILYYFPSSDTWGLCKSRFDSLTEIYIENGSKNSDIIILGVGKFDNNTNYSIISDTILPYIKEDDNNEIREALGVIDRDLYFYDKSGVYIDKINLTSQFNKEIIQSIINGALND